MRTERQSLPPRLAHHEIPQLGGPLDQRHAGAVMRDQFGDVGFDLVAAALAPQDQPRLAASAWPSVGGPDSPSL